MTKWLLAVMVSVLVVLPAAANLVWQEDFSDVSDWGIMWTQNGAETLATLTSDGTYGSMGVGLTNSGAAFSPTAFMAFSGSATWDTYTLSFDVPDITGSMSYQVGFDEFDGAQGYLSSVTIHPQGTFEGTTNYSLAGVSWNAGTAYVRPKVSMNTGFGDQTLTINDMQLNDAIPEPTTLALLGLAVGGLMAFRRRRS